MKQNIKHLQKRTSGFTLVELLLYVALSGTVLFATTLFLSYLLESRIKNQTIAEVDTQGLQIMQLITQTIRNSTGIISPATTTNATIIALNTINLANNPTYFDFANRSIRIKEGAGATTTLNNTRVIISNVAFSNLSRINTDGTIRIHFTLSATSSSSQYQSTYSKDFSDSATLR